MFFAALGITALGGCASRPVENSDNPVKPDLESISTQPITARTDSPPSDTEELRPISISGIGQTGLLADDQLKEISGLAVSARYPGVLYAINDGGNASILYAIDETGLLLSQWDIDARNRDWEDMTRLSLNGTQYLVIGDTGDNLRINETAVLHLLREPDMPAIPGALHPGISITFRYEDGPRNVEAFSAIGNTVYLLSKEPLPATGYSPHRLYRLTLPENPDALDRSTILTASFVGTMPSRAAGIQARLAASLAGVDLSYPTAMEFNSAGNTAYILTYREVLRVQRGPSQSWAQAFADNAERVLSHRLKQAEALTISPGRAIWFTSEKINAPLWAIPLTPPL